ncbi:MAG: fibronectin type III domain-containing protein, partial [Ilumatobacteraceae bacterium]
NLGAGRTATKIAAGGSFTCAILDNATVKCWGANTSGQLGQGDTAARGDAAGEMATLAALVFPAAAGSPSRIIAGGEHACVLFDSGSVICWGENAAGQLGRGDTADRGDQAGELAAYTSPPFTPVFLAAGRAHTCAASLYQVTCWGANNAGQLGRRTVGSNAGDAAGEMGASLTQMTVTAGEPVLALTTTADSTCAMTTTAVKCWGENADGQLGRDNTTDVGGPSFDLSVHTDWLVAGTITAIAGGGSHVCAALSTREVRCIGANAAGQLGIGSVAARGDQAGETALTPTVELRQIAPVDDVAAGTQHTCAELANGVLKCWGDNQYGQLGYGDTSNRGDAAGEMGASLPAVNLGTGKLVYRVYAGGNITCAILTDATVKCWGNNEYGQLGYGDTNNRGDQAGEMGNNLPTVNLGTGRTAVELSVSSYHVCALLDDLSVKCWGAGFSGRLGLGDTATRGDQAGEMGDNLPIVNLGTGRTALQVTAGNGLSCALLDNITVKCWGYGPWLGLGISNTSDYRGDAPGEMGDALPAVNLGTGRHALFIATTMNTCARLDNSTLKCWGNNFDGNNGNGTTTVLGDAPAETGDGLPVVDLGTGLTVGNFSVSPVHACARTSVGSLKCWGSNSLSQLGLPDQNNSRGDQPGEMGNNLPAVPLPLAIVPSSVVAADSHTCVLSNSQRVACFGSNSKGQLGRASTEFVIDATTATFADLGDTPHLLLQVPIVAAPPTPPQQVVVTPGVGTLQVTWAAPLLDNGAPVTGYRIGTATTPEVGNSETTIVSNTGSTATSYTITTAQPGVPVYVTVRAINSAGASDWASNGMPVVPQVAPYTPLTPARLTDTRPAGVTVDGQSQGGGALTAGQVLTVQVTGRGSVPAGSKAAALNVTAVGPTAKGFATVYPCDVTRPLASNLNFVAGVTVANAVFTDLSAAGTVCVYVSTATHILVDVNGAHPQASSYAPLTPFRLMDTRDNGVTGDGLQQGNQSTIPITVNVRDRGGVADWAETVTLNVTIVDASGKGYATVYPCDVARPLASNLNFVAGRTVANSVTTKLSAAGTVCVYLSELAEVIVDVNGANPATGSYTPVTPFRLADTRPSGTTGDGQGQATGTLAANGVLTVQVEGRGGVLSSATAAMLNVTIVGPVGKGYATVYPCDVARPTASTVNFEAGATVPNSTLTRTSTSGTVCVFVSQGAHVLVDVAGFEHP